MNPFGDPLLDTVTFFYKKKTAGWEGKGAEWEERIFSWDVRCYMRATLHEEEIRETEICAFHNSLFVSSIHSLNISVHGRCVLRLQWGNTTFSELKRFSDMEICIPTKKRFSCIIQYHYLLCFLLTFCDLLQDNIWIDSEIRTAFAFNINAENDNRKFW